MLQWIRDRVTGVVAFIILGLLSLLFVFWGADQYSTTVPPEVIAQVGKGEITVADFQTSFANERNRRRAQQGERFNEVEFNQLVNRRAHLDRMINEELLRQFTEQSGLEVAPSMLREIVHEIPQFQVAGEFDPDVYRQVLRAQGLTPDGYLNRVREGLLAQAVTGAVASSAIVTPAEIDRMLVLQNETRDFAMIEIPSEPFRETAEISDEEVAGYYEEHPGEFMTTERVSLAYVELREDTLVTDPDVDEETLRQRYEAVRDRYMTPERRRASHILISTGEERDEEAAQLLAQELADRARAGEAFSELAENYSDDPESADEGGDLGWFEPGVMARGFEDALYALEIDGISEPVQTGFGWHVIQLKEIDESRGQSFEEAREEILEEIREEEARDLFAELADRLHDLIYADPTSLAHISEDLGLEIKHTEPFARSGGEGITGNSQVIDAAFSDMVLLDGDTSEPIELEPGHLAAVRVEEHFPVEPRSLEVVEDELRERLLRERVIELAQERAEALAESLRESGTDPEALAEAEELELTTHEGVTRRDFELGGAFVNELFELPPPSDGAQIHVLPKDSDRAIVILEKVNPGDPAEAEEAERTRMQQQIQYAKSGAEIEGLLEYLRDNTRIQVREDNLDTRF